MTEAAIIDLTVNVACTTIGFLAGFASAWYISLRAVREHIRKNITNKGSNPCQP